MKKEISILLGGLLILLGVVSGVFTVLLPLLGIGMWQLQPWRLWPVFVIAGGLLFVIPPFLVRGKRGLGALFIPGLPVATTGGILFFASITNHWGAWEWLWPLEVISVALGFLFAALYMRVVGLMVPAIIIGLNGLVFQFCAVTGFWEAWAVLWAIEPLSVGLALLALYLKHRSPGLLLAALILCGIAGLGFVGMSTIFMARWWVFQLLGPLVLIGIGAILIVWALTRQPYRTHPMPEKTNGDVPPMTEPVVEV
ncbi:MAG: hypothetical protein JXB35_16710 [Anaerolineae bacterium]|nr:hypothetical protein [Anaerolineae bacterium]